MDCLSPIYVKNPHEEISPDDYAYYRVPCGRCEACVKRHQAQWFVRLKFEQEKNFNTIFVTLTYDDEHLPEDLSVNKADVQAYHKRLRAALGDRSKDFKYYLTAEYGPSTYRPHYHAIYFSLSPLDYPIIEKAWQNGFVSVSDCNDERLRYVTGYIIEKLFVPDGRKPLFNLISKALGACYIEKYRDWHSSASVASRSYVPYHGAKLPLPRYYKEKLYSESQRKVYAKLKSDEADENYQRAIAMVGPDEYWRAANSRIVQYREKVKKQHKKKKAL